LSPWAARLCNGPRRKWEPIRYTAVYWHPVREVLESSQALFCLLETIMNMKRINDLRPQILEICKRHGVETIRVFGSVARGEAGPESDLDLLVTVGSNPGPWFPGGLIADLEELLECPVQVVTEDGLYSELRESVLSEAVPL